MRVSYEDLLEMLVHTMRRNNKNLQRKLTGKNRNIIERYLRAYKCKVGLL